MRDWQRVLLVGLAVIVGVTVTIGVLGLLLWLEFRPPITCSGDCPEFEEHVRSRIDELGITATQLDYVDRKFPITEGRGTTWIHIHKDCEAYCRKYRSGTDKVLFTDRRLHRKQSSGNTAQFSVIGITIDEKNILTEKELEIYDRGNHPDYDTVCHLSESREPFVTSDGKRSRYMICANGNGQFVYAVFESPRGAVKEGSTEMSKSIAIIHPADLSQ